MENLVLKYSDKDHVWINGRQFVSLTRAAQMADEKAQRKPQAPRTRADKIRLASDEDLAAMLENFAYSLPSCPGDRTETETCPQEPLYACDSIDRKICRNCWLDWLNEEASFP